MRPAAARLRRWRENPCIFVREEFGATPDAWQDRVLSRFNSSRRLALKACVGPGKSTVLAWVILLFLLTRPFPKIACTSITKENLRDNLWSELAKWMKRGKLSNRILKWNAERIHHIEHRDTWWASARSWSRSADTEKLGETLAGLHADHVMAVVDESGNIPRAVMAAGEGVLSNVGTDRGAKEAHLIQAGNPTRRSGPLYDACVTNRELWDVEEISGDPDLPDDRRAPRVSRQWAKEMIALYGRDNPWVAAKVLGTFPDEAEDALIALSDFEAAFERFSPGSRGGLVRNPKELGVDVSRQGDDMTIVTLRDGDFIEEQEMWSKKPITYTIGAVRSICRDFGAERIKVDDIGVGGGVTDGLDKSGNPVVGVDVGASPDRELDAGDGRKLRYNNLRSQVNFEVRLRFAAGRVALHPSLKTTSLQAEGTSMRLDYLGATGERITIEPKKRYKSRVGKSPDRWDSLVLAYYEPFIATTAADNALGLLAAIRNARGTSGQAPVPVKAPAGSLAREREEALERGDARTALLLDRLAERGSIPRTSLGRF